MKLKNYLKILGLEKQDRKEILKSKELKNQVNQIISNNYDLKNEEDIKRAKTSIKQLLESKYVSNDEDLDIEEFYSNNKTPIIALGGLTLLGALAYASCKLCNKTN